MTLFWLHHTPLILASQSKTRADLLRFSGFNPELMSANIDERAIEDEFAIHNSNPADIARELSIAKALHISHLQQTHYVVGADQTLGLGDQRFHKPRDANEARHTLEQFSGRTHQLHSGVALAFGGRIVWSHVETAHMHVRVLSEAFMDAYIAQAGERVLGSVGAYQYEGLGVHLFERIEGDQSTILGLPLLPLLGALREHKLVMD